jgi:hypothetical protein
MPTFTFNQNFKKDVFKSLKFWIAYICLCTIVSSKIAFGASSMLLAGKVEQNIAKLYLKDFDATQNIAYSLERSVDGNNFDEVEKIMVSREKPAIFEVEFQDKGWYKAGAVKVYYRVRAIDVEGWFDFSPVAVVSERNPGIIVQVMEKNEVPGLGIISTKSQGMADAQLRIFNSYGDLIKEEKLSGMQAWVDLSEQKPGKYKVQVASASEVVENELHLY